MGDFLNVENVLQNLDLKEDMLAAEFGCGSAAFAISLAQKLKKGKVYALDIQQEKLDALKGKLSFNNISNVSTILCDLEAEKGSTLRDNFLDIVLIPNVLFQSENKAAIMNESKRVLKPGGQVLVIDWLKKNLFSSQEIVSPEEVKKIAESLGFIFKKEFGAGDYHYGLLFTKK